MRGIDKLIDDSSGLSPTKVIGWLKRGEPAKAQLRNWYGPRTLAMLTDLQNKLFDVRGSAFFRLFSAIMLSAISRNLCSQTSSWGHIADNVLPKALTEKDVSRAAHRWLARTHNRLFAMERNIHRPVKNPSFVIGCVNWISSEVQPSLPNSQLLVTSPPYAGAIDYALAQRLSFYLWGWTDEDIMRLSGQELGARRKRFKAGHLEAWAQQLVVAAERQMRFLSDDGIAAFVLPHKDFGRDHGAEMLTSYMRGLGWNAVFTRDRSIRQARTRQSWTSIKRETIILFARCT